MDIQPFVTSNGGNRDSNKGMDMGNNMGSMGMGNDIHLVEDDIG